MTSCELAYDFRSDTVTQPDEKMKRFMTSAPLGDDVFAEDPTTLELERRFAQLTGKEAALFFPSGCMANLTALMVLAPPGTSLYAGEHAHIKLFELGSYARLAGLNFMSVDDSRGCLNLEDLQAKWTPDVYYMTQPGVIAVENTQNILGGVIYPQEDLARLAEFARSKQVPLHMDGARLFHAAIALDQPVTHWSDHADTVMMCISKGLGAPVGSLLMGRADVIQRARIQRKLLGGGMRQSGVLAAAGLYALDHHVSLLARDHQRCAWVYQQLDGASWVTCKPPQTNILILHLPNGDAFDLAQHLNRAGLGVIAFDAQTVRLVFHICLASDAAERLVAAMQQWGEATCS